MATWMAAPTAAAPSTAPTVERATTGSCEPPFLAGGPGAPDGVELPPARPARSNTQGRQRICKRQLWMLVVGWQGRQQQAKQVKANLRQANHKHGVGSSALALIYRKSSKQEWLTCLH